MIPYLHEKLYCKTIVFQKKKHKCITSVDCAWRELLICMCVSARKVGRKKCFWISGTNVARQKGNPQWQLNNLWYNIYNLYICQKRCPEASLWMLMIVYATIPCNMYIHDFPFYCHPLPMGISKVTCHRMIHVEHLELVMCTNTQNR